MALAAQGRTTQGVGGGKAMSETVKTASYGCFRRSWANRDTGDVFTVVIPDEARRCSCGKRISKLNSQASCFLCLEKGRLKSLERQDTPPRLVKPAKIERTPDMCKRCPRTKNPQSSSYCDRCLDYMRARHPRTTDRNCGPSIPRQFAHL